MTVSVVGRLHSAGFHVLDARLNRAVIFPLPQGFHRASVRLVVNQHVDTLSARIDDPEFALAGLQGGGLFWGEEWIHAESVPQNCGLRHGEESRSGLSDRVPECSEHLTFLHKLPRIPSGRAVAVLSHVDVREGRVPAASVGWAPPTIFASANGVVGEPHFIWSWKSHRGGRSPPEHEAPTDPCSSGRRCGHQQVSPGDYSADAVLSGAEAAVSLRGGDGFIGRRRKRRTASIHVEQSRPSRSRIGDTVDGMRPRLPFTI